MLVLSILLMFLVIGAVSAADETSNETVSTTTNNGVDTLNTDSASVDDGVSAADTTDNMVVNDTNNNILSLSNNNDIIKESSSIDVTSIDELRSAVNSEHDIINIKNNITLTKNANRITNKTINGNGYTIDGQNTYTFGSLGEHVILKNINFINMHGTKANGGAFYIVGGSNYQNYNIRIEYCNFTDTFTDNSYSGGAIHIEGAIQNLTISHCNFKNTKANSGGAISQLRSSGVNNNITIEYCNFNNTSTFGTGNNKNGGAINFNGATIYNSTIRYCNFTDTYSIEQGGAIAFSVYSKAHYVNVTNCRFINTVSEVSGGAINFHAGGHSDNMVKDCYFENCEAGLNGGAIEFYTVNSLIDNCTFINCKAVNSSNSMGGAIVLYRDSYDNKMINSKFINNTANLGGGAISLYDASNKNALIDNCTFINNTAYENGGAIIFNSDDSNITNSIFINNTAKEGGAVRFNAKNGYMAHCDYTNNTATVNGGALSAQNSGSTIEDCNFTNNTAPLGNDFFSNGYTIEFHGLKFASLWLTNANTTKKVTDGAGTSYMDPAAWFDGEGIETLSFLKDNQKTTIYLVGKVNNLDEKLLNIPNLEIVGYDPINNPDSCIIDMNGWNHTAFQTLAEHITFRNIKFINANNYTGDGGVIYTNAPFTSVINCTFEDINITGNGGAIYVNASITNVEDSTFMNNKVSGNGSSIYVNGDNFMLTGSTFKNNNAKGNGTVYVNQKESSIIMTSTFQNNHAYDGAGIYIKGKVFYTEEQNKFEGNTIDSTNKKGTNISNLTARSMKNNVYVSKKGGCSTNEGTPESPFDLHTAFLAVKSGGNIIFIDNERTVYTYGSYQAFTLTKANVAFMGQYGLTVFSNIGFETSDYSSGSRIYNLTFINYTGTAIISKGSDNYAVNCIFANNTATCIINSGKNNQAINCTFINNTKNNGISCLQVNDGGFTNLTNCKFINNTNSGCVINIIGSAYIDNCTFVDNTNNTNAGVLYIANTGNVIVDNSTFKSNNATNNGGAVYNNGTLTIKNNSKFISNNASDCGGAVYNNGTMTITDSVFRGNSARYGGALFLNSPGNSIIGALFEGNNAVNGSAIYVNCSGNITLKDDTFKSNIASENGTVYFAQNNVIDNDNLIFENNMPADAWDVVTADGVYLNATVLYVSVNGGGTGFSPDSRMTLTDAINHAVKDTIIYLQNDNYSLEELKLISKQLSIVGNGSTITRNDNKSLFNNRLTPIKSCS